MIPSRYFLQLDFGRSGRESIINYEDCSRESVVLSILHRDYSGKLLDVYCWEPDEDRCSNVSEDIAAEVFERLSDHPHEDLTEFLETKLWLVRGVA